MMRFVFGQDGTWLGMSDPVSCMTHLGGAIAFMIAGLVLINRVEGHWSRHVSFAVYVFSTILLLAVSGVYHWLDEESTSRAVMRRIDHAAIFVLIAGSFTPVHVVLFRGIWRWGVLLFIWTTAITALTLKVVFISSLPEWAGASMYLGLGWVGLLTGYGLWRRYGVRLPRLALWGGLAYTVGALIDLAEAPVLFGGLVGAHELFHLAVLVGLTAHWSMTTHSLALEPSEPRPLKLAPLRRLSTEAA
ncbi:MAG: hemolysin III family protein [Phycisphaerales bacterium]